jgi:hypothetical protein
MISQAEIPVSSLLEPSCGQLEEINWGLQRLRKGGGSKCIMSIKLESKECKNCKALTNEILHKVVVGDSWMTHMDVPFCTSCKKAYDEGYKDGLDDS